MINLISKFFKIKNDKDIFIKILIDNNINSWYDYKNSAYQIKEEINKSSKILDIDIRYFVSNNKEIEYYLKELENNEEYEKCSELIKIINIKRDI